jgi:perosamine synthetase
MPGSPLTTKNIVVGEAEVNRVSSIILDQQLSGNTEIVTEYEAALAKYFGSAFASTCSSGTTGLMLAFQALEVGIGDEVIMPPTAPVMSALPILALGATPVFCDIQNPLSFALSVKDVEACITPRTKCILSVPMWGYPFDSQPLRELADVSRVGFVEDCSHAHGTFVAGVQQGRAAHLAVFSTHERKMLATGEGGFILTDDVELAETIDVLKNCGKLDRSRGSANSRATGFGIQFGLNLRLSGVLAAIGMNQLNRLPLRVEAHRKNAGTLRADLDRLPGLGLREIDIPDGASANYYSFVACVTHGKAASLSEALKREGFVSDTLAYRYQPLYGMDLFRKFARNCANAERICETAFTVPVHEGVGSADISKLADVLRVSLGALTR